MTTDSFEKIIEDCEHGACEYAAIVGICPKEKGLHGCDDCDVCVVTKHLNARHRVHNIIRETYMPYPKGKDGEPIKPGHTYYGEDGMAWTINAVGPVYCYGVDANKSGIAKRLRCEWLTKDAPDSWDSIERDCSLSPATYIAKRGLVGDYPAELMRIDLAARCNLLIGRCVK